MALRDITRKWLLSKEARQIELENDRILRMYAWKCYGTREEMPEEEIVIATVWYERHGVMYKREFICNEKGDFEEINH